MQPLKVKHLGDGKGQEKPIEGMPVPSTATRLCLDPWSSWGTLPKKDAFLPPPKPVLRPLEFGTRFFTQLILFCFNPCQLDYLGTSWDDEEYS